LYKIGHDFFKFKKLKNFVIQHQTWTHANEETPSYPDYIPIEIV
jgi:hypothetical protein